MSTSTSIMPPKPPLSLTLIVAAAPSLGIGRSGQLPWKALKGDMAYFARVTKHIPSQANSSSNSDVGTLPNPSAQGSLPSRQRNAVVMGRKTWDSIPPRFRPLKGRLNVVITRDDGWKSGAEEEVLRASSLQNALSLLEDRRTQEQTGEQASTTIRAEVEAEEVARVFVIGGSSVYEAAKELEQTKRVLMTRVEKEYECDTFFPIDLEKVAEWKKKSAEQLSDWVCEELGDAMGEDDGVRYKFEMWERD